MFKFFTFTDYTYMCIYTYINYIQTDMYIVYIYTSTTTLYWFIWNILLKKRSFSMEITVIFSD